MLNLRMVIPDEPGVAPLYADLLKRYENEQRNVKISLEQIEYDTDPQYWAKIWEQRNNQGLPDVIYTHYSWFPQAVRDGALLDISERFQCAELTPDDYYQSTLKPFQYLNRLYTVPRETSSIVVYYNKSMLVKAGLPTPNTLAAEGKWTWDSFRQLAFALTDGEQGQWGAIAPIEVPFALFPVLRSFGCDILNVFQVTHFNTRNTIQAITLIRDMIIKDRSTVFPEEATRQALFQSGKIGFMVAGYWHMVITLPAEPSFDWDVAHIPTGSCLGTRTGAGGYSIAATSPHANEAWQLIQWLSQSEQTLFLANSGLIIPALRKAANSDKFLQPMRKPVHRKLFIDALEYGKPDPVIPRWDEVLYIVRSVLEKVWLGNLEPAEAVIAIDDRLNHMLTDMKEV